jgi:maltose alpha-D-glucosyltransferase/alpha-amylase
LSTTSSHQRSRLAAGAVGRTALSLEPQWYKDAVIYEVHVRAFADSDGDGIGDFHGLRQKLDYLQDLGVTALWVLPFYPSPLRDDGYDIADYRSVHPTYGDLREFKAFLREAHQRGLRVITELVINHTSDQHEWFQRSRRAKPRDRWRDFYVWSDTPDRYSQARIIFKDFETSNWTWDPVADAYYWHRFYSHQPDLNFDNPEVHRAILDVMDYWLDMGVDGLRLDAVPYLYERDGTNCENLPETHAFLRTLRAHLDEEYPDRMFLAEANQWPEDSVAYFGDGDECHMAFHFPLMPRLFMSIHMEDRFPVLDILQQTPSIPESCQWAIFLRNHDELTLEMVTDEERDYMYRVYGHDPQARVNLGIRRRLAPLLGNNRRKIELMKALLLSLPGTPVLYYGDEIGMGDNIYLGDRNSVRTPMQWSPDRNAGFSRANPQQLYLPIVIDPEYHYETINVEAQQNNPHSLLWWTKRLIALRKQYQAFSRGELTFLQPENRKVLAFTRRHDDQLLLLVFNLSRYTQYAELDLSEFNGMTPIELFGRAPFPPIGELPYFLTLGPHSFYWFLLESPRVDGEAVELAAVEQEIPSLEIHGPWDTLMAARGRKTLERMLPAFLRKQRWYGGKMRDIRSTAVRDVVPIPYDGEDAKLVLLEVDYTNAPSALYAVPLAFAAGERAVEITRHAPGVALAWVHAEPEDGLVYDALREGQLATALLSGVESRKTWRGDGGKLTAARYGSFRELRGADPNLPPNALRVEQSNSSVSYGDRLMLKLYRNLQEGVNPDLELGRFLTERGFKHTAQVAGSLSYRPNRHSTMTLAIVQQFIASQGDAWSYTLDWLGRYFEQVLTRPAEEKGEPAIPTADLARLRGQTPPEPALDLIDSYMVTAALLGRRTAQLHLTLASESDDPAFAPERLSRLRLRSIYESMRSSTRRRLQRLADLQSKLPPPSRQLAGTLLAREPEMIEIYKRLSGPLIEASLIRCHGDYHLGQVLYTGKDFIIIDFEGEPARPVSERRLKRSPLQDVAGMLRSFDYAAATALSNQDLGGTVRPEDQAELGPWAELWSRWAGASFLREYIEVASEGSFLPTDESDLNRMLTAYTLDKAIYEVDYEMNNRPDWLPVPLSGALRILDVHKAAW